MGEFLVLAVLLFMETLHRHEHGDHATDTFVVVGGGGAAHGQGAERIVVGTGVGAAVVEKVDGGGAIEGQVAGAFTGIEKAEEIIGDGSGISPGWAGVLGSKEADDVADGVSGVVGAAALVTEMACLTKGQAEGLNEPDAFGDGADADPGRAGFGIAVG